MVRCRNDLITACALWGALAAVVGTVGCTWPGTNQTDRPNRVEAPPAVPETGVTAFTADKDTRLPSGPGADARPGDFILQNSQARFVVAGPEHPPGPTATAGHVVDALAHGGADRLRLLLTRVGEPGTPAAAYREVEIESSGAGGAAQVVATGSVPGRPALKLRTTYRLQTGAPYLNIMTRVTNEGKNCLRDVPVGDALFPGRAVRFAEGQGLFPAGATGPTDWLSFFAGEDVMGLFRPKARRMEAVHEVGVSHLTCREVSLAPGGTATFSRNLMAVKGDPTDVRRAALAGMMGDTGRLRVRIGEQGNRVEGAWVRLFLGDSLPTGLLRTGASGKATCRLPQTMYRVDYLADGYSGLPSPGPVNFQEGSRVTLTIPASPLPRATVQIPEDGSATRLLQPSGPSRVPAHPPRAPYFSPVHSPGSLLGPGEARTVAVPEGGRPALVASRGPLHECAVLSSDELRNGDEPLSVELERVVDPGSYVAVDFGQYSGTSPRCAMKPRERMLSNRCEGLHGAIVNLPPRVIPDEEDGAPAGPGELRAVEFRAAGAGRFTVLPLQNDHAALSREFPDTRAGTRPAHRTLTALRREFPLALVQATPAAAEAEVGEEGGSGRNMPRQRALSRGVDALQILHGRDVPAARKRMEQWFAMLNAGRRLFVTGGSGSRSAFRTPAGLARTYVYCTADARYPSPERLREAIERLRNVPNAFVSNGPFIRARVNDRPIGSLQTTEGTVKVQVQVSAPRWVNLSTVTIYRNGQAARAFDVADARGVIRLDRTVELEPAGDCWLVVTATGERGMRPVYPGSGAEAVLPFGITNPFWIDGDGDGTVGRVN